MGLQEFLRLLLQVEGDSGSTFEGGATGIFYDGELTGIRLPDELFIIIVLGGDHDSVGNYKRESLTRNTKCWNICLGTTLSFSRAERWLSQCNSLTIKGC